MRSLDRRRSRGVRKVRSNEDRSALPDHPLCDSIQRFGLCFGGRLPALRGYLEAVIRGSHQMKRRSVAEAENHGLQQAQLSQCIAFARHEQHWNMHLREMVGTFDPRLAGGMKREAQERQAPN